MQQIDRIALNTGWQPTEWQRQLGKTIPPMAVYGLFRDVDYRPSRGIMSFPHAEQLERARTFDRGVLEALGMVVMVSADHD